MQKLYVIVLYLAAAICGSAVYAQDKADSTLEALQQIPAKYISTIDKKIDKYSSRVSSKTIKTLIKLSRWETKIKATLQKVNPDAAAKLFNNNQVTFSSLLQQIQKGEAIKLEYRRQYDKYRDDMTTGIKYLEKNKALLDSGLAKKIQATKEKLRQFNNEEDNTEAIQQFIKERKKQLLTTVLQHLGKNKYLSRINKEAWYYGETIKNYKELFSSEAKTEKLVKDVLTRIPGFQDFLSKNNMLAGLFDISSATAQLQPGMQTRAGIQQLVQERIGAMGPGAQEMMNENLKNAHGQVNKLHNDIIQNALANEGKGYSEMPDFKPNNQKTKTFAQRLEFGFNLQFARSNDLLPASTDIALTAGYKLNDRSTAGIGASYKLGLGSIEKIRLSNEGIGLRSFIDWKLKKQFFISGGFEMNYNSKFREVSGTNNTSNWQKAALLGVSKKINIKSARFKSTNLQLLFDFLSRQHIPASQQILFRVGYGF